MCYSKLATRDLELARQLEVERASLEGVRQIELEEVLPQSVLCNRLSGLTT